MQPTSLTPACGLLIGPVQPSRTLLHAEEKTCTWLKNVFFFLLPNVKHLHTKGHILTKISIAANTLRCFPFYVYSFVHFIKVSQQWHNAAHLRLVMTLRAVLPRWGRLKPFLFSRWFYLFLSFKSLSCFYYSIFVLLYCNYYHFCSRF